MIALIFKYFHSKKVENVILYFPFRNTHHTTKRSGVADWWSESTSQSSHAQCPREGYPIIPTVGQGQLSKAVSIVIEVKLPAQHSVCCCHGNQLCSCYLSDCVCKRYSTNRAAELQTVSVQNNPKTQKEPLTPCQCGLDREDNCQKVIATK